MLMFPACSDSLSMKSKVTTPKLTSVNNSVQQVYGVWLKYVIIAAVIMLCFQLATRCTDASLCRLQVMGHIYPAAFMGGLAWSWKNSAYRKHECGAMVVFWLLYWCLDAVQKKEVDFADLKTVQHFAFTMLVGVCGLYRICRGPETDKFIMSVLVASFALFVYMHKQPNVIGETMHLVCAGWLFAFLAMYWLQCKFEGSAFMVMAATSFVCSQLALTSFALSYVDSVSYFVIATLFGLFVNCIAF